MARLVRIVYESLFHHRVRNIEKSAMSDSFVSIVDSYIPGDEALQASRRVLHKLVDWKIVESELTDCVLGGTKGYRPGPEFLTASELGEDVGVGNRYYKDFSSMKVNGLEVCVERCVVMDPSADSSVIKCPLCEAESSMDNKWSDAITEWHAASGEGLLCCPGCGKNISVVKWDYLGVLAAGHLALTFWNWPEMSGQFVQDVAGVLGSPLRVVMGKI